MHRRPVQTTDRGGEGGGGAVFIRDSVTSEDPPNEHQAEEVVVFTRENRGGSSPHATQGGEYRDFISFFQQTIIRHVLEMFSVN